MDTVKFGQKVRQARRAARCTQAELARRVGLTSAFIGHIERGSRVVSIETLVLLCRALSISPESLLADSLTFEPRPVPGQGDGN